MSKTLEQLMDDADGLIQARAGTGQQKTAAAEASFDDTDIFELAQAIRAGGQTKEAAPQEEPTDELDTVTEKVAHACAIAEVLVNLPLLVKMAQFEERARAAGHSDDAIQEALSKTAEKQTSFMKALPWLAGGVGALAAGAAGNARGKKKGREEGRNEGAAVGFVEGYRRGQLGQ